ncbi:MAG: hypothetical protein ACRCT1_13920 [Microcoleaceae cyanobacterium]
MKFPSFCSALVAAIVAFAVIFVPQPAFAALTPINSFPQSGELIVAASESQDLPGWSNTSGQPIKIEIKAEGTWRAAELGQPNSDLVDANAASNVKYKDWLFPDLNLGTLVGEIKDANGVRKFIKSGKEQTFELQPGETVSFIFNDGLPYFYDNCGIQRLKFSITQSSSSNNNQSVVPIQPPKTIACTTNGSGLNPDFAVNIPYKSFANDSPFKNLKTGSDWFYLEDFKDGNFALNTPGVSASSRNETDIYKDPGFFDSVDEDDGSIDGKGRGQDRLVLSKGDIKFTFDKSLGDYPTDVGIVWTDFHGNDPSFGSGRLTFEAFDASGKSFGAQGPFVIGGDYSTMGETNEDRFFGLHSNGGISAIKLTVPAVTNGVEFDHLQYGHKCRS